MADINFNPAYGDLEVLRDDIKKLPTPQQDIHQRMIMYFKTNFNDYRYSSRWGLDLDSYIGMPIDTLLAEKIKAKIENGLVNEGIITDTSTAEVLYIVSSNKITFRIIIYGFESVNLEFIKDKGFKII